MCVLCVCVYVFVNVCVSVCVVCVFVNVVVNVFVNVCVSMCVCVCTPSSLSLLSLSSLLLCCGVGNNDARAVWNNEPKVSSKAQVCWACVGSQVCAWCKTEYRDLARHISSSNLARHLRHPFNNAARCWEELAVVCERPAVPQQHFSPIARFGSLCALHSQKSASGSRCRSLCVSL